MPNFCCDSLEGSRSFATEHDSWGGNRASVTVAPDTILMSGHLKYETDREECGLF